MQTGLRKQVASQQRLLFWKDYFAGMATLGCGFWADIESIFGLGALFCTGEGKRGALAPARMTRRHVSTVGVDVFVLGYLGSPEQSPGLNSAMVEAVLGLIVP